MRSNVSVLTRAKTVGICLTLACVFAPPAIAAPYITFQGGANFIPKLKLTEGGVGFEGDFEAGWSGGAALGFTLGNGFAVELEGLYADSPLESLNGIPATGGLKTTSAMLGLLYEFEPVTMFGNWRFKPFAGAGAGLMFVESDENGAKGSDSVFGYQLRGGLRYDLTPSVAVQAEYRWSQGANAEFTLRGVASEQEVRANSVLLGIRYTL